jgi:hypothetical protein
MLCFDVRAAIFKKVVWKSFVGCIFDMQPFWIVIHANISGISIHSEKDYNLNHHKYSWQKWVFLYME